MNAIPPNETVPAQLSGTPFQTLGGKGPGGVGGLRALEGISRPTDLSVSILPLLEVLGWRGDQQQVAEALPHFVESIDITSFRNILASLGYASRSKRGKLNELNPEDLPCLFLPDDGDALIVAGLDADQAEVFDSGQGRYIEIPLQSVKGEVYFFSTIERASTVETGALGWFRVLAARFQGPAMQALLITVALNLLALATPLFVMVVYDWAIAGGSLPVLGYLAIGAAIALVLELLLRSLRWRIFAYVGARLDHIIGIEVFRKILHLPAAMIERANIGRQVSRIKDFETVRKFFAGPVAPVLFELPFVLLFIAVIVYLGGAIAIVPIVLLILTGAIGLAVMPLIARITDRASEAETQKQELTVETLNGMRVIKYCGAEKDWLNRYRTLSAKAALQSFYKAQLSSLLETLSHGVTVVAGFATVALGVAPVQAGTMTLGALVACLILVWRALQPLQTGLVSLARLSQVSTGVDHLDDLMDINPDSGLVSLARSSRPTDGRVTFDNVAIRYEQDGPPALNGATFDIKGGKIIAVLGSNGAGKSTMLKLLAGIYQPGEGSIQIDGRDLRDINPAELRRSVAYVPQTPEFFYGTIAQNLRLANPTATDEDLRWALRQAGALDDIEALEQGAGGWKRTGWDVRLGDKGAGQASPGLLQRLNLARGYLKRAPIILLDEPGNGLDLKGDQALLRALSNLRGETTIFIVTHRPSHLKMADRIIWLEYGSVRSVGRPKVVMQKTRGML